MGWWRRVALVSAVGLAAAGCTSAIALTDEGTRVRRVTDAEKPGGCRLLGDVSIGVPPDAARPRTEDELILLMRNKAGEAGGDHLVVDASEQRNATTERPYWTGRGRAYACPEETRPPEEPGAGGGSGDEGSGDDTSGDEVPSDEDLLSDDI